MIYLFFDESWKKSNEQQLLIPTIFVPQQPFNSTFSSYNFQNFQSASRRINFISDFLKRAKGFAFIGIFNLSDPNLLSKERDSFGDVKNISRTDDVWSWSVIYTIASVVRKALDFKYVFKTIDIYYDRKDLKCNHKDKIEEFLKTQSKKEINKYCKRNQINFGDTINIRRFQYYDKPKKDKTTNKFQRGIWLADQIVRSSQPINVSTASSPIYAKDLSELVHNTLTRLESWDRRDALS